METSYVFLVHVINVQEIFIAATWDRVYVQYCKLRQVRSVRLTKIFSQNVEKFSHVRTRAL